MTQRARWQSTVMGFVCLLSGLGCGSSHSSGDDPPPRSDGGMAVDDSGRPIGVDSGTVGVDTGTPPPVDGGTVVLDAGTIGTDAGHGTTGGVGTPCTTDEDCDGRFCAGAGVGYCSWLCADDVPCPDGAVCSFYGGSDVGYCLAGCDPAADSCGDGLVCSGAGGTDPVCVSGCTDDDECDEGQRCGPGFTPGVGQCYSPAGEQASPCETSADCALGQFCLSEASAGFPGGACLQFGCDDVSGAGCTAGYECVPYAWASGGVCMPACLDDDACRDGYECRSTPAMGTACVPRCSAGDCGAGRVCDFLSGYCVTTS